MSMGREALRREAKKLYKEQTKNIPRRNRVPFSQFFKQFRKLRNQDQTPEVEMPDLENEDFNFEDLVNINEVDDDNLEEIEEPSDE